MYQGHPNFRKQVLQYHEQLSNHMFSAQGPQQVPVPMTPMDFSYSQSMLPANLLSTPSPYVNHPTFLASQQSPFISQNPPSPFGGPHAGPHPATSGGTPFPISRAHSSPMLMPYVPQKQGSNSLEHLNFSRTIVLSGLSPQLSLHEVLDAIDHGPIENVELKDDQDQKTCCISFVNTHISYHFHQKYAKNAHNLKILKDNLKDSLKMKIAVNDLAKSTGKHAAAEQDVIKVKTLNYIMEFNATRAITITFRILDPDLVPLMEKAFRTRCARFGIVEDFLLTEDEDNSELEFCVHFSSIDAAIKVYEHYSSRIASVVPGAVPPDDDRADLVQLSCLYVSFQRDRCDRTSLAQARRSFSKPVAASEASSLKSASPTSAEPKVTHTLHNNRSASHSISQESSRASDLRSDFKALDITSEPKGSVHELSVGGTRATSEQSSEDPKTSFADNFAEAAEINFGSDGSGPASPNLEPTDYFADHSFNSVYSGFASDPYLHHPHMGMSASANGSLVSIPQYQYHPESLNSCNRTIYLGNLHPKTTVEEIANNVRAGGLVESIKHYQTRRVCFVTFIDPAIALKFYLSHQVLHQLVIRDSEVTVNWGRTHSGPLSRDVAYAVTSGASRNVYIGFRMNRTGPPDLKIPDENTLRKDFSKFGGMEQINYYHRKECGFMNFLNIADAIRVVECFDTRDVNRIREIVGDDGQFYEKYRHFKISYGKDRCGNPLKFSYVKRKPSEGPVPQGSPKNVLPDRIDPIDEESAYVFGITTNTANAGTKRPDFMSADNIAESTVVEDDSVNLPENEVSNPSLTETILEVSNEGVKEETHYTTSELEGQVQAVASHAENEPLPECENDGDDSADDADEDDDISIIINPETSDASHSHPIKKERKKPQKIYHNNLELSDLLNAAYNTSSDSSLPHLSFNHSFDQNTPSPANQSTFQRPPPLQYPRSYARGSFSGTAQPQNGSYGSGSQVMAEYLAKSSHDNYLYAATVLNGDVPTEDIRNVKGLDRKSFKR